jgi:hypothetical protein
MHFLLHENAMMDATNEQPGYHYVNVNMKAKPLQLLPYLKEVSCYIAKICGVNKWTIGVDPVLYRGGKDKMGNHANNNQGKQIICALLVAGSKARKVTICPFTHLKPLEGDAQIELILGPGNASVMDGQMQASYLHSVPPDPTQDNQDNVERIAIVFRTGEKRFFTKDSGRVCTDLSPKVKKNYNFGNRPMKEGTVYIRRGLYAMEAHLGQQHGISGNHNVGSDAMMVCSKWPGCNDSPTLLYTTNTKVGANAIIHSYHQNFQLRVFCSETYKSPFQAKYCAKHGPSSKLYRYNGLYRVVKCEEPQEHRGQIKFFLERFDARDHGVNFISNKDIFQHCELLGTIYDKANRDFLEWVDVHTGEED